MSCRLISRAIFGWMSLSAILVCLCLTACVAEGQDDPPKHATATRPSITKKTAASKDTDLDVIRVVYSDDFAPLSWKDEDGVMHGILVDVVEEIFRERMNFIVHHRGFPWERAQKLVIAGGADAVCASPSSARAQFITAGREALAAVEMNLVANATSPHIENLRVLPLQYQQSGNLSTKHPKSICAVAGDGWVADHLPGLDIVWVNSPRQGIDLVSSQRIDLFVNVGLVTEDLLEREAFPNVEHIQPALDTSEIYLCMSNQSAFLRHLPEFDEELTAMKADGRYQAILDRYH